MRSEVIVADSIDAAVERILVELKEDTGGINSAGNNNVIYFDGWDGLGASAVLRAVAAAAAAAAASDGPAPTAGAGLQFDQIIHVDCSKWESRRSLQRAVAEQLQLPAEVMEMFERQDEEDDYKGVAQGSRAEIPQVLRAMYQHIQKLNHRFLLIFHNGSKEEMDLTTFGFPLFGYSTNKVLWTFQGRFRLKPRMKVENAIKKSNAGRKTDVFLSASSSSSRHDEDTRKLWSLLVHQEAAEVALDNTNGGGANNHPSKVSEFFLYMLKLCCIGYHFSMDYGMATHSSNYWMCDAIIQEGEGGGDITAGTDDGYDDGSWQAGDAMQLAMRFDADYYHHGHPYMPPSHLVMCGDKQQENASPPYWLLPIPSIAIPNADTFQYFDKLSVLKLSHRTFSLASPPFIYCHSLKFLWLDHCQQDNQEIDVTPDDPRKKEDMISRCFQRLWVLDVRSSHCEGILSARMLGFMTLLRELNVMGAENWDMGQLQGRLPNIRKLRVTKSTVSCSANCLEEDLFSGMNKMELLDLSGNRTMHAAIQISTSSKQLLETLTVADGCAGIEKLSFRGCANLKKNLLLSGLFEHLRILDLSGAAVKMLDLSAMTASNLKELSLDGCEELCAILWPPEDKMMKRYLQLHVDTTWSGSGSAASLSSLVPGKQEDKSTEGEGSTTRTSLSVAHGGRAPSQFYWRISVKDTRLLKSLVPLEAYFDVRYVQMEMSSHPIATFGSSSKDDEVVNSRKGMKQWHVLENMEQQLPKCVWVYADVAATFKDHLSVQAISEGGAAAPALSSCICRPCPPMPSLLATDCYMYIQDHQQIRNTTKSLQGGEETKTSTGSMTVPDMISCDTSILHVHDSLSITSIPGPAPALGSRWNRLDWCRVERCPKLEYVFASPLSGDGQRGGSSDSAMFPYLNTLWASQLPKACFIWNWSTSAVDQMDTTRSFYDLEILHLDLCPRLVHVLPLSQEMVNMNASLWQLQTLEIVWCSDLRVIFPLYAAADAVERERHQDEQQQPTAATTVHLPNLKHLHLHELPMLQGIFGRYWRVAAPQLETVKIRGCWSLKRLPDVSSDRSCWPVECDCEKEWWDKLEWDGLGADHHPSLYKPTHSRYYQKALLRSSVLR